MSRLLVFTFDAQEEAGQARSAFRELEKHGTVGLDDAVVLEKDADGVVNRYRDRSGAVLIGAVVGAIMGSLLVFMFPIISTVVGAGAGAFIGKLLTDQRVEEEAVEDVAAALAPCTSALLVLIRTGQIAALEDCLRSYRSHVFRTSLPPSQEAWLRQALH